mgnify:CR=1 FL=1|tara:strand:+ start:379 stop:573 length:195 start_codon:yes stop_codon:yes gene_type:complete
MSEEQTVNIDGTDYKVSDFSPEQIRLVNHVADLDRQINKRAMYLEQSQVSRNHFIGLLKKSLSA